MSTVKPMTDPEIVQAIYGDINSGVKFSDGKLTTERDIAFKYYYGEYPKRLNAGSSGYRSLDVYDQVETARALLMETFVGNQLPLEISPRSTPIRDAVSSEMATQYVNDVVFSDNGGESIIDQVIFDALMSRIGVARVYWEEYTEREVKQESGVPMQAVEILAQDPMVTDIVAEVDPATGLADIEATIELKKGRVVVEGVRPEDLLVNTQAKNLGERTVAVRVTKRMSEWKADGYAEEDLRKALTDTESAAFDETAWARADAGDGDSTNDNRDDDPLVTLIEAYLTLDEEQDGNPQLTRVLLADQTIIEKDVASRHGLVIFQPIPVPHIFHGSNFVQTIIPTANAKTALTRSIIDHAMRTNNPRYQVLRGTLASSRELLDNRLGGLVNVDKPDGIKPLAQASMNPFTFQTISLLDSDLSDTTGISRLTQGQDKEVISQQNSRGMMQDVAEASQRRFRVMARRFASGFLAELAKVVYAVAQENDAEGRESIIGGQPVQMSPQEWPKESTVKVSLNLSPDQKAKQVTKVSGVMGAISEDPDLRKQLSYSYKRKIAVEAMKLAGLDDAEMAINPEPPQPDPMAAQMQQIEMQAKVLELDVRRRQQAVAEMKAETDRIATIGKLEGAERDSAMQQYRAQAEFALEQRKQASKESNDIFEKELTLQQVEENPDQVASVISVNR